MNEIHLRHEVAGIILRAPSRQPTGAVGGKQMLRLVTEIESSIAGRSSISVQYAVSPPWERVGTAALAGLHNFPSLPLPSTACPIKCSTTAWTSITIRRDGDTPILATAVYAVSDERLSIIYEGLYDCGLHITRYMVKEGRRITSYLAPSDPWRLRE